MAPFRFKARCIAALVYVAAVFYPGAAISQPADGTKRIAVSPADAMARGAGAMRSGDFEQAVLEFGAAAEAANSGDDAADEIDALSRRADAFLALGQTENATRDLRTALSLAEKRSDSGRTAALLGALGRAYLQSGLVDDALRSLQEGVARARTLADAGLLGTALNNLGLTLAAKGRLEESLDACAEAAELAVKAGNAPLAARALVNAASAALERQDLAKAGQFLARAGEQARAAPDSNDKSYTLTAIGQLYRRMDKAKPSAGARQQAYHAYADAAQIAGGLGDRRAASYSLGYLGQFYEEQKRLPDAHTLTRQALFHAQQVGAPEMLFLWHWQTGRLQRAQGDVGGAIASYRQAVHSLQALRQDSQAVQPGGMMSFREAYGPVYFEMADLLLRHASAGPAESAARSRSEARNTLELLKAAELRDYFQDDCVTSLQARISGIDDLGARTAAVYPVMLEDRTELLVSLRGELRQFTVPITAAALNAEIRTLRKTIVKRTTREYLPHARRLYDWLIRPMAGALEAAAIDTLVFVPDGALRTIPMGALHDGKRFLIEDYAVGTTPGLTLTDARPLRRDGVRALLTGVSKPLRGFPGLPDVSSELSAIGKLYGGKVLQDAEFRVSAIEHELSVTPYSIVHIASHAQFDRDPRKTFLLAFDDSLTMNKLEQIMALGQFRRDPVELLTLSACQTAAGDERAALGMAGAAVKAGARSVLASLWFVSDVSTSVLIGEFYRQLREPSTSKARSLQLAQRKLISERQHRHPGLWSPFLLIGNWL